MSKRKTKAQREQEQKCALRQRISDIYAGANHGVMDEEEDYMSIEAGSVAIPVIREVFGEPSKDWFGFSVYCIGHFETVAKATDFLFDNGFRADRVWETDEQP